MLLGVWVSNRFENLGFRRRVIRQTQAGNIVYFTNHDEAKSDILLLGYLDTVYDFQSHVPFVEGRTLRVPVKAGGWQDACSSASLF